MYRVYSLFLFLALLLYAPFYFARAKFIRKEGFFLRERLGIRTPPAKTSPVSVWIHAVSVGEVLSLQNLVPEIKKRHPEWEVYFSSLTFTGLRMAREKIKGADHVFFVPLDFTGCVRRILEAVRPDLLILAESEFWPNLLREAKKTTKGILLINGRISAKSYRRYLRLRPIARNILGSIDRFLVQTPMDKDRLERINISPDKVNVGGNLKTEVKLPEFSAQELAEFKRKLGIFPEDRVLVAGSTRKGEEERLLRAFRDSRIRRDDLRVILAPRRVARFEEVEKLALDFGFRVQRRTNVDPENRWDVLILDTLGELAEFYALSDVSFVGGSLVDWGGHNILEPAFYGKPVFFGPHTENFALLARSFISAGAARIITSDEDLANMFALKDEPLIQEMGRRAREVLDSLSGATTKTILAIEEMLGGN